MKKYFRFLITSALIAGLAASCSKTESLAPEQPTIHFTIRTGEPGTRTFITPGAEAGKYVAKWNADDKIAVFTEGINAGTTAPSGVLTNTSAAGTTAVFDGTAAHGTGTLFAVYPSSGFDSGTSEGYVCMAAKTDQKPTATSFDPAADILVSEAVNYPAGKTAAEIDDFKFARTVSIVKINLLGEYAAGQTVESFSMTTATTAISGKLQFEVPSGKLAGISAPGKSISAEPTEAVTINGTDNTIWLTAAPVTIPTGEKITFTARTANYDITKEVTLEKDMALPVGNIATINLTINSSDCTARSGEAAKKIAPIICFFKIGGAKNTIGNGTITDNTKITLSAEPGYSVAGASIEKVGGTANKLTANVATASPFNVCFTTVQWNTPGTYLLYTVPVQEKTWGDLEFNFSVSCGTANMFDGDWNVSWSTNGTDFQDVDAVYAYDVKTIAAAAGHTFQLSGTSIQRNRQVAEFSIAESDAVSSGNLYFKVVPPTVADSFAAKTLRVNSGCYVCSRVERDALPSGEDVLAAENFNNSVFGCSQVIGSPVYYMTYLYNTDFPYEGSWTVTGDNVACRGCLLLNGSSGNSYVTSPALSTLTGPTDVTLSFKAALYIDAYNQTALSPSTDNIQIQVNGSGTAGSIVWDSALDSDPYSWHNATVTISGASSDTTIGIGVDDIKMEKRFYIDDIVIRK